MASPQFPDYVIFENDTIPIYNLILEKHFNGLKKADKGQLFGLKFRDGATLNCWRGYQAIYEIKNNKLYLKHIVDCGELFENNSFDIKASNDRINKVFKKNAKNNQVFINWYSGELSLPKGKLLRWDGVFHKSFEREFLISFKKGKIIKSEIVENYIDDPNRINRKYGDSISSVIFEELKKSNWKNNKNFDCSENFEITIGENGKVSSVTMPEYRTKEKIEKYWETNEYNYCLDSVLDKLKKLEFDILKRNGKNIEEKIYLEIWVEDDGSLENWTE